MSWAPKHFYIALVVTLYLLFALGLRWILADAAADRDDFEQAWWLSFRQMTFARNSTFSALPDSVRRSAEALFAAPPAAAHETISGQYHGQWPVAYTGQTTAYWNGTLPEGYLRPANSSNVALEMSLDADPAVRGSASLVSGTAQLRNGVGTYLTTLDLQGLYWGDNGTAMLFGVPEISAQTAMDVVRAMPSRHAFEQAQAAYSQTLDGQLLSYKLPEEVKDSCSYQMYLRFGAAPGEQYRAQMIMFAPNCDVLLAAPSTQPVAGVTDAVFRQKGTRYFRTALALLVVQVVLLLQQSRRTKTHAGLSMISHYMLLGQVVIDGFGFHLHLIGSMSSGLINMVLGFVTAVAYLFSMSFNIRYLMGVWRVHRPDSIEALVSQGRDGILKLYLRFYAVMAVGLYIIYEFSNTRDMSSQYLLAAILAAIYSYWLPQIYLNVQRGVNRHLRVDYIIGITATRLFVPAYFLACPDNAAFIRPSPLIWYLVAYNLAQAAVLVLQRLLGGRFFIPPPLRPAEHDYCAVPPPPADEESRIDAEQDASDPAHTCSICLMPVVAAPLAEPAAAHAVTPCLHVYHGECLASWMEIKLECPVCRTPLPPT